MPMPLPAFVLSSAGALVAQEIRIHSTAVVLDFEQREFSLAAQDHIDESVIAGGFCVSL